MEQRLRPSVVIAFVSRMQAPVIDLRPFRYIDDYRKCSDCYDFCLPDYGIERDSVRGAENLNIIKRICFYLFVPEWRTYAQANSIEQNQRDFETYYRNRNHLTTANGSNGVSDSKWITLQQLPQTIQNVTGNLPEHLNAAATSVLAAIGGMAQGARAGVFGRTNSVEPPQNIYYVGNGNPNSYNGFMQANVNGNPSSPVGFLPVAVNGAVNMNGVNGHKSNTAYSMNGETSANYGISTNNGFANKNPYSSDRSILPQGNMMGYSHNGNGQQYNGNYASPNQASDQP
uniref:Low complexity protein n=1 Tax=Angiostrongylus cantonensis TaxID=6313 RepID=A0A0K0DDA3_ANGCA